MQVGREGNKKIYWGDRNCTVCVSTLAARGVWGHASPGKEILACAGINSGALKVERSFSQMKFIKIRL